MQCKDTATRNMPHKTKFKDIIAETGKNII